MNCFIFKLRMMEIAQKYRTKRAYLFATKVSKLSYQRWAYLAPADTRLIRSDLKVDPRASHYGLSRT